MRSSMPERDEVLNRFRQISIPLKDEECNELEIWSVVCVDMGEDIVKLYRARIDSKIKGKRHTRKGCACEFVVCWLEGRKAGQTEPMRLDRIYKIQPGPPDLSFRNELAGVLKRALVRGRGRGRPPAKKKMQELLEQGLVRRSGSTIEDESNVSTDVASRDGNNLDYHDDQLFGVTIDTGGDNLCHRIGELEESCNGQEVTPICSLPVIIGKLIHENVLEGTVVSCDEACEDEDASEVLEYVTDVEEMPIKKIKPLVEIRRKSHTKEQHKAKLLDGFSALVKPPTCYREMEIKKIFGDITDRYKGTFHVVL